VLQMDDVKARLLDAALLAVGSTPKEFAALIRSETETWTRLAADAGVKPQ
jgi:tripartite-type tricarboxylate transporter receptor subunit TctC